MKVAILAGGFGSRLSEETAIRPKPLVEIGGKPILWHIMKIYASFGFNEFVIALGYKGEMIKDYFINYRYISRSLTINLSNGDINLHNGDTEEWVVSLLDTGIQAQTGDRVKQIAEFIGNEPFMMTYGDGVANVNINDLLQFHINQRKFATVTAVRPPSRFGGIAFDGNLVSQFEEKPQIGEGWINGGFFVMEPDALKYISGEGVIWEKEPMEHLTNIGQLAAYKHDHFWQCMDTLRDVRLLDDYWRGGHAPWKVW